MSPIEKTMHSSEPRANTIDATYKVLVLGETSVGKTALINCLVGREFQTSMLPTVGK